MEDNGILDHIMKTPTSSPDSNLIKNVWASMKQYLFQRSQAKDKRRASGRHQGFLGISNNWTVWQIYRPHSSSDSLHCSQQGWRYVCIRYFPHPRITFKLPCLKFHLYTVHISEQLLVYLMHLSSLEEDKPTIFFVACNTRFNWIISRVIQWLSLYTHEIQLELFISFSNRNFVGLIQTWFRHFIVYLKFYCAIL